MDPAVLADQEERIYVIYGIRNLFERLSADGKEKLQLLIEKAESVYRLRFILIDSLAELNAYTYAAWFKRHLAGADGLWIGDGVADQYLMKIGKLSNELYQQIGPDYGYLIVKGRPVLVKLPAEEVR